VRNAIDRPASAGEPTYDFLDGAIRGVHATGLGFTQLVATRPYSLDVAALDGIKKRHATLNEFFDCATDVLEAALAGDLPDDILSLLLNETPESVGADFHRRILARRRSRPQFYRTDEVGTGRIVEIQCPGSLWGDCEALAALAAHRGEHAPSLAEAFTTQLTELLGPEVRVHHLLDNASAPHTMRYFLERTRPTVRYFGIDPGVTQMDCGFVRSHSFFGQVGENFFRPRLQRYLDGELLFDLPPLIIFDEKITLALPFMDATRQSFSDDVRNALIFSTPVTPTGFSTPDGDWLTLEQFASGKRDERRWFLKYAGSDVSINWGSRAVYTLDNVGQSACLQKLQEAALRGRNGQVWIVQPQEQNDDVVEFIEPNGASPTATLTAKHSTFYGPGGYLGTLVQHRRFYKVHGQNDTIVSLGTGDPRPGTLSPSSAT
jgi:hypothetical protein